MNKSLTLTLAVTLMGGSAVFAQNNGQGGPERPQRPGGGDGPAAHLKEQLKLTEDQAQKLKDLMDDVRKEREAMRKELEELRQKGEELRKKAEQKRQEILAKAKSFLNDDQYKKLTDFMEKMQARRGEMMRRRGGPGGPGGDGVGPGDRPQQRQEGKNTNARQGGDGDFTTGPAADF